MEVSAFVGLVSHLPTKNDISNMFYMNSEPVLVGGVYFEHGQSLVDCFDHIQNRFAPQWYFPLVGIHFYNSEE